ncbi:MAG: M23 family metallopeptidase [Betaproteobacteria bacterium]|nr:M23 family metallopeptidase [Betaproteobacteria bacterium]
MLPRRHLISLGLTALIFASADAPGAGAGAGLDLPLQCAPGESCWISNHVDLDPGPGTRDYACGRLTYDGHKGTDFALRDLMAMNEGVAVLAAAAGVVLRTRDGEPDISVRVRGEDAIRGRECGNAVVIEHAGGLETQYCHLRRGSVAVKRGTRVAAGDRIGLVGLSGETEYPHLHVTMRHRGRVIDPFRGTGDAERCGPGDAPLWKPGILASLPYSPGALYNFGVAPVVPSAAAAREGAYRSMVIPAESAVFAVWAEAYGVAAGDSFEIHLDAPDGKPFIRHSQDFVRNQARIFRLVARKRGHDPWPVGTYRGRIRITRVGEGSGPSVAAFSAEVR